MFRVVPYRLGDLAIGEWPLFKMPPVRRLSQSSSPFRIFGVLGILCGTSLAVVLAVRFGIYPLLIVVIAGVAFGGFLSVAMVTKLLCGYERLVFLHQQIVVLGAAAMVSALCFQMVWRVLDICSLGLGLVLAFGRLGCLTVGCCHGRPCRWGVSYGRQQVRAGFPPWLQGVRLFPVQAVESLWVLCLVAFGCAWIMGSALPPGVVFGFYITSYAAGRFFLEFFRGDEERPYLLGFSEAQWTSVVLVAAVTIAERTHILPALTFPTPTLVILMAALIVVSLARVSKKSRPHALFTANHLNELARTLIFLRDRPAFVSTGSSHAPRSLPVHVVRTSAGLKVSLGRLRRLGVPVLHVSLSREKHPLGPNEARGLARVIGHLYGATSRLQIVAGSAGNYHLLLEAGAKLVVS